jgi:hypothetical protein
MIRSAKSATIAAEMLARPHRAVLDPLQRHGLRFALADDLSLDESRFHRIGLRSISL